MDDLLSQGIPDHPLSAVNSPIISPAMHVLHHQLAGGIAEAKLGNQDKSPAFLLKEKEPHIKSKQMKIQQLP